MMSLRLRAVLQENLETKRVWTANSDGTLTPELMAVYPEPIQSRIKQK